MQEIICGETKCVAAIAAKEFRVACAMRNKGNVVACEEADRRMLDKAAILFLFQKSVTASASVLCEAITFRDGVDFVSEQIAEVAHLFMKGVLSSVTALGGLEQQRVSTLLANKFDVAVARAHSFVIVAEEKAGSSVADARLTFVLL
ncbi:MAG: hypothetical protein ABR577_13265 [Pyrinomonadaceae bacterium]